MFKSHKQTHTNTERERGGRVNRSLKKILAKVTQREMRDYIIH